MNYIWHLVVLLATYGIVALGLNLMAGYCGRLALSQAAFFGIGAYAYAVLSVRTGCGFIPAAVIGMGLALTLSLLISLPAARFRGDFFVILSLTVQVVLYGALYNWAKDGSQLGTWANLTNGPFGITGISKPYIGGLVFSEMAALAMLATACLVLVAVVYWRLTGSPWGRLLKALRDDEDVTAGLGKNVRVAEASAFGFCCAYAALAGAVFAGYLSYIDPSIASLDNSVLMLSMVIVGGMGNLAGPLVGAVVLVLVPELLRSLNLPGAAAANVQLILYGAVLVAVIHRWPQGLAGTYRLE